MNISKANMSEPEQMITKEFFAPVIRKFDHIKIVPQYTDECWSTDMTDRSSLSRFKKALNSFLPLMITIQNLHGQFFIKTNQETVQNKHSR